MNIRQKLLCVFMVSSAIIAVFGFLLVYQLGKITKEFEGSGSLVSNVVERINTLNHAATLDKLALSIKYYDEVLTQSARNYAFTGDGQWKLRYKSAEPELDVIIKKAISQGGDAEKTFFTSVDESNQALVKLEYRSIELVDLGRNAEAIDILESKQYSDYKAIYKTALDNYIGARGANFLDVSDAATSTIVQANLLEKANFAQLNLIYTVLIVAIPTLIAVILIVGYRIANNINTPIKFLIQATDELAKGNYSVDMGRQEKNEMGILAERFDQMRNKLRERETMRDDFLKIASHELRTPIQPILGYVELARKNIINKDKALDEIYIQVRRLSKIAKDVIDASRLENGLLPLNLQKIDYNEIIENAVSAAKSNKQGAINEVTIQTDLSSTIGLVVSGDRERLIQALTSILDNAIEFTKNGNIKVSSYIDIASMEVQVEVQDSGIGISEKILPRLFERFATTSGSDANHGGAGLSLHLSAKIIESHKGKMWGKNNLNGVGAVFGFSLPFRLVDNAIVNRGLENKKL
jgi:signal transduction histidine kinase